jgi:transcriptional regulator with XRE-family HTH domain
MKEKADKQDLKKDIYAVLGENIKLFRNKKNLSLNALAVKAGISFSFLSNIEKGRRKATLYTIEKIAVALECGIYRLLTPRSGKEFLPEESAIMLDIIQYVTTKGLETKRKILNIIKLI